MEGRQGRAGRGRAMDECFAELFRGPGEGVMETGRLATKGFGKMIVKDGLVYRRPN